MQWLYRFLAIGGFLAILIELHFVANPRYRAPTKTEWEKYEDERFTILKPKQWKDTLPIQFKDIADLIPTISFQRDYRTRFEIAFRSIMKEEDFWKALAAAQGQTSSNQPPPKPEEILRKAHNQYLLQLREIHEEFKKVKSASAWVSGYPALVTEYQYVRPQLIPIRFLSTQMHGLCVTLLLSSQPTGQLFPEYRVVHMDAYTAESAYSNLEPTFRKMIASFQPR